MKKLKFYTYSKICPFGGCSIDNLSIVVELPLQRAHIRALRADVQVFLIDTIQDPYLPYLMSGTQLDIQDV